VRTFMDSCSRFLTGWMPSSRPFSSIKAVNEDVCVILRGHNTARGRIGSTADIKCGVNGRQIHTHFCLTRPPAHKVVVSVNSELVYHISMQCHHCAGCPSMQCTILSSVL